MKEDVRVFQSKDSDENIVRETRRCWEIDGFIVKYSGRVREVLQQHMIQSDTILGFAPRNNWNRLGARQDLFAFTGGDDVDIV